MFERPLRLGQPGEVVETVLRCEAKQGSAGPMTLLTVGYDYRQSGETCIREERDFMYLPERTAGTGDAGGTGMEPVPDAPLAMDHDTDAVLLFRFSALTFNSHRIHYDADYAREVEGYPERVVHGPLTALLLARLASREGELAGFEFRARAPLFLGDRLRLRGTRAGNNIDLAAYRPDGAVAMTAEAKR